VQVLPVLAPFCVAAEASVNGGSVPQELDDVVAVSCGAVHSAALT
jgi:hypothetical protein